MTDRSSNPVSSAGPHAGRTIQYVLRRGLVSVVLVLGVIACGGLLSVSDPTLVQDSDIANPSGANARRLDAEVWFEVDASNLIDNVALFTDERMLDEPTTFITVSANEYLDRRDSQGYETMYSYAGTSNDPYLGGWDDIITRTSIAIEGVRAYSPDSVRGDYLGQLYAERAYTILQMAEDVCSGFPINDVVNNLPVYGTPLTTDSAVKYAIAEADSALKYVQDTMRTKYMAEVVKGRALLDLGRYADASTAVADVPSTFKYVNDGIRAAVNGESGANPFYTQHFNWTRTTEQQAVGDREGGNGMPFVSAADPRVKTVFGRTRYSIPSDSLFDQTKYISGQTPIVLSSGLEAQLIQAEAALNAGDPNWFNILNTLRATMITPAMAPIPTMPTATKDQVDLLYRERAFWLYLTGRRLGDMRRLIHNYGRDPETVFPTGNYPIQGARYGTGTAIPFIEAAEAQFNPHITTGCTTR
jgi:hypothetical protein